MVAKLKNAFTCVNSSIYETCFSSMMTNSWICFYFILIFCGFVVNYPIGFECLYPDVTIIKNFTLNFYFYQLSIAAITIIAFASIRKFETFSEVVKKVMTSVNDKEENINQISQTADRIKNKFPLLILVASYFVSRTFVKYTRLNLNEHIELYKYAAILVFAAAFTVIVAYTSLINLIITIRKIYKLKFEKYTYYYPITTEIFEECNSIVGSGLVRFWIISILVIALVFLVVSSEAAALTVGIIVLIIIGFVLFTIYPYYYTRKKVSELKMQTISKVVSCQDFAQNMNGYSILIKIVQESPSNISSNSQMLFWSSTAAVISAILPILTSILSFTPNIG